MPPLAGALAAYDIHVNPVNCAGRPDATRETAKVKLYAIPTIRSGSRMAEMAASFDMVRFDRFTLDTRRCQLLVGSEPVALHRCAYQLLAYLVAHVGEDVSHDEIVSHVWQRIVAPNNVSVQLHALRKALKQAGCNEELILTLPSNQYRFVGDLIEEPLTQRAEAVQPSTGSPRGPASGETARRPILRWAGPATLLLLAACVLLWRFDFSTPIQQGGADKTFAPPPHSIAVLAFTNMSGDPSQEYFSDGLSEELIDLLARVRQLRVVARTSSFAFKGKAAMVDEIARKLNVSAVLEGSVRQVGGRLRVTAQLIDATNGYDLWSHSYDREVSGILGLQSEIAAAVANALEVTLLGDQADRLAVGGTHSPAALDAFLKGTSLLRLFNASSSAAALTAFNDAIRFDPVYADAFAGRAEARAQSAGYDYDGKIDPVKSVLADALVDASKAVALADLSGRAHATRGLVLESQYDMRAAATEYSRALALDPGNADIESGYAGFENELGHRQEAVEAAQRAVLLDPLNPFAYTALGYTLAYSHRYDESLTALRHAQALAQPNTLTSVDMIATVNLLQGKPQEAMQYCSRKLDGWHLQCTAIAAHQLGHTLEAKQALNRLQADSGDRAAFQYAEIYAQWGDTQTALKWLRIAYDLQDVGLTVMRVDPFLDPIRRMPEFRDLERKLNFPI